MVSGDAQNISLVVERKVEVDDQAEANRIFRDLEIEQTEADGAIRLSAKFKTGWKPQHDVREDGPPPYLPRRQLPGVRQPASRAALPPHRAAGVQR